MTPMTAKRACVVSLLSLSGVSALDGCGSWSGPAPIAGSSGNPAGKGGAGGSGGTGASGKGGVNGKSGSSGVAGSIAGGKGGSSGSDPSAGQAGASGGSSGASGEGGAGGAECRDVVGYAVDVDDWCFDRSGSGTVVGCTSRSTCPDAFLCGQRPTDDVPFVFNGCRPDGWEECENQDDVVDCEGGAGGQGGASQGGASQGGAGAAG